MTVSPLIIRKYLTLEIDPTPNEKTSIDQRGREEMQRKPR